MPITVSVYAPDSSASAGDRGAGTGAPGLQKCGTPLTLDAPRVLVGRGEGCEIRVPDPSISHRHLSIRQRGTEHVLVDEGSTNGTRVGKAVLAPHASHTLGPHQRIRVGRVWLEITIGADLPTRGAPQVAKENALEFVRAALEAEGEDGRPKVQVVEGASAGVTGVVESGGTLVVGRGRDAGLVIDDAEASRRHVEIRQRGDTLVVRDLASKAGTRLGERQVGEADIVWKRGDRLVIGSTALEYTFEAAEALAEIERSPDVKIPPRDLFAADEPETDAPEDVALEEEAAPEASEDQAEALGPEPDELEADAPEDEPKRPVTAIEAKKRAAQGGWNLTDVAVMLLAVGVFSLSAVGYWVLLR